jgi:hypothetical protein
LALARVNLPVGHLALGHIVLEHFALLLLCALLAACALRLRPGTPLRLQVRGVIRTFLIFVLTGVTLAWIIYPLSH